MEIIKKQKMREVLMSLDVEMHNIYCDEWYDDMDKLKTLLGAQSVVSIDLKSVEEYNKLVITIDYKYRDVFNQSTEANATISIVQ